MEKVGVTFQGVYSEDIGIYTEADLIERPIFPEVRKQKITIMGRHGAYDFSGEEFEERNIQVTFKFSEEDELEMRKTVRQVAQWLRGKGALIFDDEPDKYYIARVFEQISLKESLLIGEFKVDFECEPFAFSSQTAYNEYATIDDDFELDTGYIYPNESSFDWIYSTQYMGLYNHSEQATDITFNIIGTVENPKITHIETGNVIEFNKNISGTLIINTETYIAQYADGTNLLADMTGDFFKLQSGANSFKFEAENVDCVVNYTWNHKFL